MANRTKSGYQHHKMEQQDKEVGHFYHEMFNAKKQSEKEYLHEGDIPQKYKNLWYVKTYGEDHRSAAFEEVAQELSRLIMPSHPEGRIISSDDKEQSYVTSRQVAGFTSLSECPSSELYARCAAGKWKGLGGVVVEAIWVDDRKFKKSHLGLDENHNIVRVYGERSFGELRDLEEVTDDYDLSSIDINQFPFLEGIYAYSWLDIIHQGRIIALPDDRVRELRKSKQFRTEINEALMKIAMLPDALLTKFVQAYLPASETFSNEIIHLLARRRDDLLEAAYKNQSFCRYMQSEAAKAEMHSFLNHIGSFTTVNNKHLLPGKEMEKIEEEVVTKFERVREKTAAEPEIVSPETRKKMAAIISEYINSMAVFKTLDEKTLGWVVAKSKNAEHAKERVAAMIKLRKLVTPGESNLGFNECEDLLADMLLAEAKIHQESKYGEVFLEAGKYSHCIHAVKTLMDADRSRQLQINNQARSAPAA